MLRFYLQIRPAMEKIIVTLPSPVIHPPVSMTLSYLLKGCIFMRHYDNISPLIISDYFDFQARHGSIG